MERKVAPVQECFKISERNNFTLGAWRTGLYQVLYPENILWLSSVVRKVRFLNRATLLPGLIGQVWVGEDYSREDKTLLYYYWRQGYSYQVVTPITRWNSSLLSLLLSENEHAIPPSAPSHNVLKPLHSHIFFVVLICHEQPDLGYIIFNTMHWESHVKGFAGNQYQIIKTWLIHRATCNPQLPTL